jgi:glycolate oxidase FAD binding subunit
MAWRAVGARGGTGVSAAERIREAFATRTPLRIEGAGTWLGAGRPVRATSTLSMSGDGGIVEYVPGDLTLTARAGTRLTDIVSATRAHAQWLPLDPWGGDDGTIGALVSTATAGPHSFAMGLPRDTVLGLEFVTGTGSVVRSGGRVVKNVAGFDLTRLLVGSWGTLGVITEVTLRLRARPELTRTLAIDITPQTLGSLAARLRALPFSPLASELLNPSLARKTGLGEHACLLVQLGGNERSLHAQQDVVRDLGSSRDAPDDVWNALRRIATAAAVWRWSQLPSQFGETWTAAEAVARQLPGTMVHGNPARGVVRVVVPDSLPAEPTVIRDSTRFTGTVAIESLPAAAWADIDQQAAGDPISRAIRAKFDPAGILNTGILGDAA